MPDDEHRSDERVYLEFLRRGMTGGDEMYLHKFGILYDAAVDEITRTIAEDDEVVDDVVAVAQPPESLKHKLLPLAMMAVCMFVVIWAGKVAVDANRLKDDRAAFEKQCEERIAMFERCHNVALGQFVNAQKSGDLDTAHSFFTYVENLQQTGVLAVQDKTVHEMRSQLALRSLEAMYGAEAVAKSTSIRAAIDEMTQAMPLGTDPIKDFIEQNKNAICGIEQILSWSLEPDTKMIAQLLSSAADNCEWLFAQPVFNGPMLEECNVASSKTEASSLFEISHDACEQACKALEDYCNDDIQGARCALLELEVVLEQIGEMVGAK